MGLLALIKTRSNPWLLTVLSLQPGYESLVANFWYILLQQTELQMSAPASEWSEPPQILLFFLLEMSGICFGACSWRPVPHYEVGFLESVFVDASPFPSEFDLASLFVLAVTTHSICPATLTLSPYVLCFRNLCGLHLPSQCQEFHIVTWKLKKKKKI